MMKRRWYPTKPRKHLTSSGDVGVGHVVTFSVLSGSISTPAAETICPTNFTFHFFGASFKLACCIRSITRHKLLRCSSYVFPKIITSSMKTQQIRRC